MDINYLFHRQQVERSRAEAARSEEARRAHSILACRYEQQIEELSDGRISFDRAQNCEPTNIVSAA
jgi:hypothetical protein